MAKKTSAPAVFLPYHSVLPAGNYSSSKRKKSPKIKASTYAGVDFDRGVKGGALLAVFDAESRIIRQAHAIAVVPYERGELVLGVDGKFQLVGEGMPS